VSTRHGSERRTRVVVIGWGSGGLFTARALRRADAGPALIADTGRHLFQSLPHLRRHGAARPQRPGDGTRVVPSWRDGPSGVEAAGEVLLPEPTARLGATTFDSWLAGQ
jgi:hypothetical protein